MMTVDAIFITYSTTAAVAIFALVVGWSLS
jgi:hypothetical protein